MVHAHTLLTAIAFTLGTFSTTVLAAPLPIGMGVGMSGRAKIFGDVGSVPTFEEAPGAQLSGSPPFTEGGDVNASLLEVEDQFGVDEERCPPPPPPSDFRSSDAYDDNGKTTVEIVIEDERPPVPPQDDIPPMLSHPVEVVPVPESDPVGDEFEQGLYGYPLHSRSGPASIERRHVSGTSFATGLASPSSQQFPPTGKSLATGWTPTSNQQAPPPSGTPLPSGSPTQSRGQKMRGYMSSYSGKLQNSANALGQKAVGSKWVQNAANSKWGQKAKDYATQAKQNLNAPVSSLNPAVF
ncbi:hypothetical protein FB446DRAFT_772937 [Lentinula raphanica]|nr:hypothetical protein FB446DRAFT_772937 [Lentinula raphanica]